MQHVLVTGATGFIGARLVEQLARRGLKIRCLVRESSNRSSLLQWKPDVIVGSLLDSGTIGRAVGEADVVINLAGTTKALDRAGFQQANVDGPRTIAECCASQQQPPVLVHVSSLAAVGPSETDRPQTESDCPHPVSDYGRSKLAGEQAIKAFADRVPISIVRPPIVLGPGDRDGLEMFKSIADWGVHIVPGSRRHQFSVIDVDDLCRAIWDIAQRGTRLQPHAEDYPGTYFVADPKLPTYEELGQMIGTALGKKRVRILTTPPAMVWGVALIANCVARMRKQPFILSLDKAREANAGSWACSADRLVNELAFEFDGTLQEKLDRTVAWYVEQGWLKTPRTVAS